LLCSDSDGKGEVEDSIGGKETVRFEYRPEPLELDCDVDASYFKIDWPVISSLFKKIMERKAKGKHRGSGGSGHGDTSHRRRDLVFQSGNYESNSDFGTIDEQVYPNIPEKRKCGVP